MSQLIDEMPEQARPEDPLWTLSIMTSQVGLAMRCMMLAEQLQASETNPERVKALLNAARGGVAGLLTQTHVLCEQLGWDPATLVQEGVARFKERMSELAEGKI